jgi:iron complex outermembrane receptor protein
MLNLKRDMLSVALASAIMAMAMNAQAQAQAAAEAEDEEKADEAKTLDEVIVTSGIRRGIEDAIELKRDATSIVEAISAEDIGKLPDSSIAESIARLPGLAAQRVAGRASEISIRGLDGNFSTTNLNGREQISTSDSRSVEFDQYPSELLSSVVVYKTPDASLTNQGLSGTVDLRTVRPLEFDGTIRTVGARMERNSIGEQIDGISAYGSRVSASFIDQFADNRVGVALGLAYLDSPGQARELRYWGFPEEAGQRRVGGFDARVFSSDNKRLGVMGTVQFKPNDSYNGVLDVYYSDFERNEQRSRIETGLQWSGASLAPAGRVVDSSRGVPFVVGGTYNGVTPQIRNDAFNREDKVFSIGLANEFTFNDNLTGLLDLTYNKVESIMTELETYAGLGLGNTSANVGYSVPLSGYPTFSFNRNLADPSIIRLTDSAGWGQDGYIKSPEIDDELSAIKGHLEYSFDQGFLSSIEGGFRWSDREKSRASNEAFLDLPNRPVALSSNVLRNPTDMGYIGIGPVYSYNPFDVLNRYTRRGNNSSGVADKNWDVSEELQTAYVQLNFDGQLGAVGVRGNIGVQHQSTEQESTGFVRGPGSTGFGTLATVGTDYSDTLPSLNVSFLLPWDQTIRFGAAEQLARPRIDQMTIGGGFGVDQQRNRYSGGGGNPLLEPWRATSYDVSYEKYFAERGYVSLAYFHKDLDTYIYQAEFPFDFSVFNLSQIPNPRPPSTVGVWNAPFNGKGGTIKGLEFAFSLPLDLLWAPLEGFGLQGSYSDTDSEISAFGPGNSRPLPGLSKYVSNITAYYEKDGFSARVSRRTRSDYVAFVRQFDLTLGDRYIGSEQIVDFQTGYEFREGTFKGVSLLFQVNNVTNEPYRELDIGGNYRAEALYGEYGRTYLLGAVYKF